MAKRGAFQRTVLSQWEVTKAALVGQRTVSQLLNQHTSYEREFVLKGRGKARRLVVKRNKDGSVVRTPHYGARYVALPGTVNQRELASILESSRGN